MLSSQATYLGPIRPNYLFYRSFTQVRGNLSLFFHYVDLEYEVILSSDIIGPNKDNYLFSRSFTQVRANLTLFFHYVDLEYVVILSNDIIGPNKAQLPLLSLFHPSTR